MTFDNPMTVGQLQSILDSTLDKSAPVIFVDPNGYIHGLTGSIAVSETNCVSSLVSNVDDPDKVLDDYDNYMVVLL